MPNHKSAIKRMRQNEKRRKYNKSFQTRARKLVKEARQAIASGEVSEAEEAAPKNPESDDELAEKSKSGAKPVDEADTEGVVAVTNRVTGDFVLELNADAADVTRFVDAARAYGRDTDDGHRYRVELTIDGEPFATVAVRERPDGEPCIHVARPRRVDA